MMILRTVVLSFVLIVVVLHSAGGSRAPQAHPSKADGDLQPTTSPSHAASRPARPLAGSSSCRECHEPFYKLWATSHHGLAMQPYSAQFAESHLTPHSAPMKIGEHEYQAAIGPGEGWIVERADGHSRRLPLVHVLGGKNVYFFLTPGPRGRLQTTPLAYDVRKAEWYDTTRSAMRHFPSGVEDAPLHWSDPAYTFNTSCHSCHVSQLETNYDLQTDTYRTTWAEPGINCETCHGSAAEHIAVCRAADEGETPPDLKLVTLTQSRGYTAHQVSTSCAGCHAKMVPLTAAFEPGGEYFDHYDLSTLEDRDFYADARDLGENYTYTLWRLNPCAKSGQLDCMHCHTSSGRFRFVDRPNDSCLPCHAERVADPTPHTHHAKDSDGSLCIHCHMPMTTFARMRRSDHSVLPPTPAATIQFESPNACNLCHTHADESAEWADQHVREWHERDYQAPVIRRAKLIAAARKQDWTALPDMLRYVADPNSEEVFATGLLRLLAACPNEQKWPAMIKALGHASPLVRASAAQALDGHLTRESVPALLKAARDQYRLVRIRAAAALAAVPPEALPSSDRDALNRATDEMIAATRVRPDDYASHYNRGNLYHQRGDHEEALKCYKTALRLRSSDVAVHVNMALTYNALGRNDDAERALREAIRIAPESVEAHLNLGMLLGEMNRPQEAQQAFLTAYNLDNKSARAAYNLAVLSGNDDIEKAVYWGRRAHEIAPHTPRYVSALAYYLRAADRSAEARDILDQAIASGAADANVYIFAGQLHEEAGNRADAAAIYRAAAADERLHEQHRAAFLERAAALE